MFIINKPTIPPKRRCHVTLISLLFLCACFGQETNPSDQLRKFIESQEEIVERLAQQSTEWHTDRIRSVRNCECSRHACSNDFLNVDCLTSFGGLDICETEGRRIDYNRSVFRTPIATHPKHLSDSLKENICIYRKLGDAAIEYGFDELGWVFIGTRDGHFRSFPGAAEERGLENGQELWNLCRAFDPRTRPWFIGASTGPKDIVLVVDKSASMLNTIGNENRTKWDLVLDAVGDIIDTFTFADYVAIVTFSNKARTVPKRSKLLRGRAENLALLKEALFEEVPSGKTNFTAAFETAFPLLWDGCDNKPAQCSNCEKIILFLTDGSSGEDRESIKPSEMAMTIQKLQEKLKKETTKHARIFTYSMSDEADDSIPRQIACANGGAWAFIGPETNTLDALNSYYLFVAAGRRTEAPSWIEPYEDAGGLGNITTVAVPFYARGTKDVPDVFLGVVGHDVPLWELEFEGVTQKEVFAAIFGRAQRCALADITPCELQVFRNANDKRALCPDPVPILSDTTPEAKRQESNIQCHAFRNKYYQRSVEEVKWKRAVSKCENSGGQLVSIEDEKELAFLANMASNDGTWIGAKRTKAGSFAWLDKSLPKLRENSDYWGVQEPISIRGTENCAAIDSRGVIANLKALPCNRRATYICMFESDSPCLAGVANVTEKGFLNVPPLNKCVDEIEALDETRPVKDVKQLTVKDVMCDLGKERTSEELLCCDNDGAEEEVAKKMDDHLPKSNARGGRRETELEDDG